MTRSALDDVPGLGEVRRKALLRQFGSLKRLRVASADEIATVPGIGPATAQAVVDALAGPGSPAPEPAVNTATGELLDEH
jgi:excinuclease ABC subunit C